MFYILILDYLRVAVNLWNLTLLVWQQRASEIHIQVRSPSETDAMAAVQICGVSQHGD